MNIARSTYQHARGSCPTCGDVRIRCDRVSVRLCLDEIAEPYTYVFRCPSCDAPISRICKRLLADALIRSGAQIVPWRLPTREVKEGAPITSDDLLDFHRALEACSAPIEELTRD